MWPSPASAGPLSRPVRLRALLCEQPSDRPGNPGICEVDIYGALSVFIGTCVSQDAVTLLDINNTVRRISTTRTSRVNSRIPRRIPHGFHCGNTCSGKLTSCSMKYQLIMARSLPEEVTQGTLEGDIVPGDITFFVCRARQTAGCAPMWPRARCFR